VQSNTLTGYANGTSTIRYSTDVNGCKVAMISCYNPLSNQTATIIGFNVTSSVTLISSENDPFYATAQFTCQSNGQYIGSSTGNTGVFNNVTCAIPITTTSMFSLRVI
jgi:hypothetical protein